MDTAELIRRAQAGDRPALDALLAAHRDNLRRWADLALDPRVKARIDASDIVQQTCLSVFQQIVTFQGDDPAQFAAWLRRLHERNVQNAVRDQLQAQKRAAGREEMLDHRGLDASGEASPSQRAMQREDADRLEQALAQLPHDERAVLQLRYLEGCTLPAIADRLGISKDAVVWLMQKGIKRVRQLLDDPQGRLPA